MSWFDAIIIAIVEGLTEFLPVSSTGHMIITEALLGIESDEFTKAFTVNIQFGAILAVVVMYIKRFFQSFDFYIKLAIACIPLVIAFLLEALIDQMLESVLIVAIALFVGGIVLIFVDRWFKNQERAEKVLSSKNAFVIGLFQIIAVIPGISRSAATIIGGMTQGLSRKQAAEFSFFLAVPTMLAASVYKLYKNHEILGSVDNLQLLAVGNVVAFVVAILAIKGFIAFLNRYGFKYFGYYRIILGGVLIVLLLAGYNLSVV
ncbi:MAG: UDP-diphosphatase [Bacteroidetes bacterium GWF2_43_63]|nr:MAG: UDP-diphosphatase [Bacteroidetes bacterium GWE2_42_42]OFY55596.1 MAG: UDP-diphosphatase [Bacteroidetes bacterium GWF2_43_63]HBG71612.1 undecaprenyl-diphosphate phosphatase [Bacteroidales bacterium]HCB62145.1 undecaprenyl-diphosphate phosphatase [Bacteroidales bacterium]HCY22373.1 undecaprenyl-diphosphate phosphatase [Bacteroidales bacterium]